MRITNDWHIHSRHSCDAACMEFDELIHQAAIKGITAFGVTDHVHTPHNLPDLATSRDDYLAHGPPAGFYFGVELSCVSAWELQEIAAGRCTDPVYGMRDGGPPGGDLALGLEIEDRERFGLDYVIGGTHWPLYVPLESEPMIRDYHRQNMYLATHPMIDIIAHPWWLGISHAFSGSWLENFDKVPASMHDEFAAAVLANGKAVEVNIGGMLMNTRLSERFRRQYLEFLASVHQRGVPLAIGSDCHNAHYEVDFEAAATLLAGVGLNDVDLWQPATGPIAGRIR